MADLSPLPRARWPFSSPISPVPPASGKPTGRRWSGPIPATMPSCARRLRLTAGSSTRSSGMHFRSPFPRCRKPSPRRWRPNEGSWLRTGARSGYLSPSVSGWHCMWEMLIRTQMATTAPRSSTEWVAARGGAWRPGSPLPDMATVLGDALPPDATLLDLGDRRLKDLQGAERVSQLLHPELPLTSRHCSPSTTARITCPYKPPPCSVERARCALSGTS